MYIIIIIIHCSGSAVNRIENVSLTICLSPKTKVENTERDYSYINNEYLYACAHANHIRDFYFIHCPHFVVKNAES